MTYLDVSPLINALRSSPEEFEVSKGYLYHIRSKHAFLFDERDNVRVTAECNCALLMVRADQERELVAQFREWQSGYRRPLETDREFAAHFSARPWLLQAITRLAGRLHRWLLARGLERRGLVALARQTNSADVSRSPWDRCSASSHSAVPVLAHARGEAPFLRGAKAP